jgi:diguanylate cyclase (GGDEF)-like protein/PAS domain S-box-containing protein
MGCYSTALMTAFSRSQAARPTHALAWLAAAACIFGMSVWALHFLAMLAYRTSFPIAYNIPETAESIVVVIAGGLGGMILWWQINDRTLRTAVSGTIIGLSVSAMHFLGLHAMRVPGLQIFDHHMIAAAVAISVLSASVAMFRLPHAPDDVRQHVPGLSRRHSTRPASGRARCAEVALWLVAAIMGLHFTGMTALTILPGAIPQPGDAVLGSVVFNTTVASVCLLVVAMTLGGALIMQRLARRSLEAATRVHLLQNMAEDVMIIHRGGLIQQINDAGIQMFGRPSAQMVGKPIAALFAEDGVPAILRRTVSATAPIWPEEAYIRTANGRQLAVHISCQSITFRGTRSTVVAIRDLTARKDHEARISNLALHDVVTDLPGWQLLTTRMKRAIDAANSNDSRIVVMFMDLDHFKPLNDLLGHSGGDKVLGQVATRLQRELRGSDTLARVGGDEFVLLIAQPGPTDDMSLLAQRLIDRIEAPFDVDGRVVEIGVSIGVAIYPRDGTTPDTLTRAADTAMYRAKLAGRGTYWFYRAEMDIKLLSRRQLEYDLRHAVQRGEMRLLFQPIVNGHTGEVSALEALIRWQHPQRGLLGPDEFIPLAESTGAIVRIGQWCIDTACAMAAEWPHPWVLTLNMSPSQFRLQNIDAAVENALTRAGLDPQRLEIEITESVFINDTDRAIEVLSQLRAQGVSLALDDFGTGYSSLSYLRLFQFDKVKIDRTFIPELDDSKETAMILTAIIRLCQNLQIAIVAEGVENEMQLSILTSHGCDYVQGYLFGRPLPINELSETRLYEIRMTVLLARRQFGHEGVGLGYAKKTVN